MAAMRNLVLPGDQPIVKWVRWVKRPFSRSTKMASFRKTAIFCHRHFGRVAPEGLDTPPSPRLPLAARPCRATPTAYAKLLVMRHPIDPKIDCVFKRLSRN